MKKNIIRKVNFVAGMAVVFVFAITISSCGNMGSNKMTTVEISNKAIGDSTNFSGDKDITMIGKKLFSCFKGEHNQKYLQKLFPDSAAVAMMYSLAKTKPKTANEIDSVIVEANKVLSGNFKDAQQGGLMENVVWENAELDKMMTQATEEKTPPGRFLFLYGHSGEVKFKISAKCMVLDDVWFIAQDIKFRKY